MAERSRIQIFFEALGSERVRQAFRDVQTASSGLNKVGAPILEASLKGSVSAITGFGRSLGGIIPIARVVQAGVQGVYAATTNAAFAAAKLGLSFYAAGKALQPFYESASELTSVVLALRALNSEIDKSTGKPIFAFDAKTGGMIDLNGKMARQTGDDLSYLNKIAFDHGVQIRSLSRDYLNLKASTAGSAVSLESMRSVFTGVADAGVVLGLSPEQMSRAYTALNQVAGKGQLYAEELKGQLAEAIPGAVPMVARAFGVSVKELNKMIADGQISSASFFDKFGKQLRKEYGEAAKAMANTTRIAAGRLSSAWFNAKVAIGNGKLDDAFARIINSATKLINTLDANGAFTRFGAKLADSLDRVGTRLADLANDPAKFERVLDGIAAGFDRAVRAGLAFIDLGVQLKDVFNTILSYFTGLGLEIPTVEGVIQAFGNTIEKTINSFMSGQFSDNPLANYMASVLSVFGELAKAVLGLSSGTQTINSIGDAVNFAAYWMGQLAHAIRAVATNYEDVKGMDGVGASLAEGIERAISFFKKVWLILNSIVEFAFSNREAFAGFFGAAVTVASGLLSFLQGVIDAINFIGVSPGLATFLGGMFVVSKIVTPTLAAITGMVRAYSFITTALGIGAASLGIWLGAVVAIAAAVYLMRKYWDEITTVLKTDLYYAIGGILEGLSKIVGLIPGLRDVAGDMMEAGQKWVDAANNEKSMLKLRQVLRQGEDYKALTGSGLTDAEAIDRIIKRGSKATEGLIGSNNASGFSFEQFLKAQREAARSAVANDNVSMLGRGTQAVATGQAAPQADFSRPVKIYLSDGTMLDAIGRDSDGATYERLAAQTARNRPGQSPAWAG